MLFPPRAVRFCASEQHVPQSSMGSMGSMGNIGNIGNMDFLSDEPDEPINKKMIDILERLSIKGTKLYWLLKRCLDEEPKRRSIIFI